MAEKTLALGESATDGPSRRTVVAATAWGVPAVVVASATPAFAATSDQRVVSVSAEGGTNLPAAGAVTLTVSVKTPLGVPMAGEAVSLAGPQRSVFVAVDGLTDTSGKFSTTCDLQTPWAKPGSSAVVTAVSGTQTVTQSFVVLGANALGVGYNSWAEMGDGGPAGGDNPGTGVRRTTPSQLLRAFPSPVVQVAAAGEGTDGGSSQATFVLLKDGTVWSVGGNGFGQLGTSANSRTTWAQIQGLSGVTQIAASKATLCALLSDGTLRTWGDNYYGQLGDGSSVSASSSPVQVRGLPKAVTQIAAQWATFYALLSDGSVWAWGAGNFGQRGDGSSVLVANTPVQASGLSSGVAAVSSSMALMSDGSVKAWGGFAGNSLTPVSVSGLTSVVALAGGASTGYALRSDGSVWAWGRNNLGQVGNNSTTNQPTPVQVSGLASGVTRIAASGSAGYALLSDGTVKAWGGNSGGQLGDGTTTNRLTPVTVGGLSGLSVKDFAQNSPIPDRMYFITAVG
ncbi:hypothetical protein [uncultured Microbacterium sp.]|uniref:RCC1 domain-containing protein n=1 Tax=uncultured Microbacterium sp. TaxID=191216 RepID=UPI0026082C94|nr:hypothetical protein [uncultured Microbacterium sp.]